MGKKAERRNTILKAIGKYLEHNPPVGEIRDVLKLPYAKEELLDALYLEVAVADMPESAREVHKTCSIMLADFQVGVGPESLGFC